MNAYSFYYGIFPTVPVSTKYEGQLVDVDTLIDSGSDYNISFKIIGEAFFGIRFPRKTTAEIIGIDKKVRGWRIPVEIDFCDEKFTIDVIWLNRVPNPEKNILMILGRNPLFDKFDIEFKRNKTIIFRK
jgi:hypothetical protein